MQENISIAFLLPGALHYLGSLDLTLTAIQPNCYQSKTTSTPRAAKIYIISVAFRRQAFTYTHFGAEVIDGDRYYHVNDRNSSLGLVLILKVGGELP
jgi:hypothetical protein